VNEEEIKIKYILPWLKQSGLDISELQFEQTFSVKIGRQTISVSATSTKDKVGARLDILVKRGNKNLLIVETKACGMSLTNGDRDQAVSYARLVHPIAPYAVVTNGNDYKLYDSITKNLINPSEISISGFEAALPEADIAEAQHLFLALNPVNLIRFCKFQVEQELRVIKGTLADGRKYIPELHVPREDLIKALEEFYKSEIPGLLLVGQSGSGKTCELCSIAEILIARGKPVLFFNGFSLENEILNAIVNEFSWTFNGIDSPIQVVKRMESFVGEGNLTIIVDAVDEWTFETRVNHLGTLLQAIEQRKIKIILSCKASALEQFLSQRGNPTKISLLTKRKDISALSDREFFQAIDQYKNVYQFFGGFEDVVLSQARDNPFLLRVLFDVAKSSNIKHLTFSSAEFFEAYYLRSISKTSNKISEQRRAQITSTAIAGLLYEQNVDWLPETDVRNKLGLGVNDSLMEELFEFGILLRSLGSAGEPAIGFYFQQLRDYIIAFKALQFNKMSNEALKGIFEAVTFPSMRNDVFALYYRLASSEHKRVFDRELYENAAQYLRCYTTLIQEHFPTLKKVFTPNTDGRIGFIGELFLPEQRVNLYGFRAINDGDDEIYFTPVHEAWSHSNLADLNGANGLHATSSANDFRIGIDVTKEIIDNELLRQIRLFVKQGRLNEVNNPDMLAEFIVGSIETNKNIFKRLLTSDQQEICYPIKLDSVEECLLREKLARHFYDEIVERKRKTGEIKENWDGTTVSYSYSPTLADDEEVAVNIEAALLTDKMPDFMARYSDLNVLESDLSTAINQLRITRNQINERLLKYRPRFGWHMLNCNASEAIDDLKAYLCSFYSKFLTNYKILVETNFPTLRHHFELYSKLPVSIYLVIKPSVNFGDGVQSTSLSIYFVNTIAGEGLVKVADEVKLDRSKGGFHFMVDDVLHEGIFCTTNNKVESLLFSLNGMASDRFRGMNLRSLVYSTILQELSVVENAFRKNSRVGCISYTKEC
jgi:hypothetical protein